MEESFLRNLDIIEKEIERENFDELKLVRTISLAEAFLHLDDDYKQLNRLYSRYLNISKRYLLKEERSNDGEFRNLTKNIIELFKGEKNKESNEIEELKSKLSQFNASFENSNCHEIERVREDSSWGKIAKDYIN